MIYLVTVVEVTGIEGSSLDPGCGECVGQVVHHLSDSLQVTMSPVGPLKIAGTCTCKQEIAPKNWSPYPLADEPHNVEATGLGKLAEFCPEL